MVEGSAPGRVDGGLLVAHRILRGGTLGTCFEAFRTRPIVSKCLSALGC